MKKALIFILACLAYSNCSGINFEEIKEKISNFYKNQQLFYKDKTTIQHIAPFAVGLVFPMFGCYLFKDDFYKSRNKQFPMFLLQAFAYAHIMLSMQKISELKRLIIFILGNLTGHIVTKYLLDSNYN